jgi:NADH dehydrogenase I D subunit
MVTEELKINIGPQHPSTHGVLRLVADLDGEYVKDIEAKIGYLHRGMEKLAESRNYQQYLPMVDRIDYLSGFFNAASFCYAVEALADIKVPKRAEYIRLITMELNRIASHLFWLGTFLLDLGATSPLFYTLREREVIVKLFEDISGQRLMYNYYCFGGVKRDMPDGWLSRVREFCEDLPSKIDEYETIITNNPIFLERTKGVGILSKEMALDYGITGPNLRASGVRFDARKHLPYGAYRDFNFDIPILEDGDCYARYQIRLLEMRESAKLIQRAISRIPGGAFERLSVKRTNCGCGKPECAFCGDDTQLYFKKINAIGLKIPPQELNIAVESSRGLSMCYVKSNGTNKPDRVKWRTPSFSATQVLPELCKGGLYADVMAILGSLDIVLPEVDR